jgi:hypothetical protein
MTERFSHKANLGRSAAVLMCALGAAGLPASAEPKSVDADVCIYAATPSGLLAAVAVRREGRSVVVVEPSRWAGGVLGSGLKPMQDCPNYNATGGLTKELLRSLGHPAWPEGNMHDGKVLASISPKAIREDFMALLGTWNITVLYDHRIARCEKSGGAITAAAFDLAPFDALGCPVAEPSAREDLRVSARVFIDASYEGDLMAKAGVSYRVGREAASEYGEENAGVQPPMEEAPIDPFVVPGHPESGLLKWVEKDHGKPVGAADGYTQAYNYRYYTTSDPTNRIPLTPPAGYDPKEFELVGRYVAHLVKTVPDPAELKSRLVGIFPGWMNSGEWNYQRSSLFSMSPVGISHLYADGDYAAKARVWKQHQDYLRGLHEFMSTDARVPEPYRSEVAALGLDRRPHPDTGGWPHQLYVRVTRRMSGNYTVTAHDVYNRTQVDDPVCLAQYGIDTYPARRIWFEREGKTWVGIEGKMFIGGGKGPTNVPYPIPYRAITPKAEQCVNLLVPICFSATHLGYASARMEPVFMMCGESSGIAACHALAEKTTVQGIDRARYRAALEKAGQKLTWDTKRDTGSAEDDFSAELLLRTYDRDGDRHISRAEWDAGKKGWEWLFPLIDTDNDGLITAAEYRAFQAYKAKNPDWQKRRPKKEH